jgi:hypothetical protein
MREVHYIQIITSIAPVHELFKQRTHTFRSNQKQNPWEVIINFKLTMAKLLDENTVVMKLKDKEYLTYTRHSERKSTIKQRYVMRSKIKDADSGLQ